MTRDERRRAIAGPVGVGGAEIDPVLLTRLVNDVGGNPDQLSILQHALNRTWARWLRDPRHGPIELRHYEDIGTMAHALDQHAEKAYGELSAREREICEKLFKALTDKATDPRGVRRPTSVKTLLGLTGATIEELTRVVDVFRKPSRSFLMPPAGEPLKPETVIDISHESLMRVWDRLRGWADDEARSAATYRRLSETAALHAVRRANPLTGPELDEALAWRNRVKPDAAWAERYAAGFPAAMDFLKKSAAARDRREGLVRWSIALALVIVMGVGATYWRSVALTRDAEARAKFLELEKDKMTAERAAQDTKSIALQSYTVEKNQLADTRKLHQSFDALAQITAITATATAPPQQRSDVTIEYFRKPTDSQKLYTALKELGFNVVERTAQNPRETNCIWYGSAVAENDVKLVAYAVIRAGLDLQAILPRTRDEHTIQVGHNPNVQDEPAFTTDAIKTTSLAQLARDEASMKVNVHGTITRLDPKAREGTIAGPDGPIYFRFAPNPEPLKVGDRVTFKAFYGSKRVYAEGVTLESPAGAQAPP